MKREEMLEAFVEKNDIETEITESTKLSEIEEWDSLAAVTTLALFYKNLGLKINASDIKKCITIKDLLDLGNGEYDE